MKTWIQRLRAGLLTKHEQAMLEEVLRGPAPPCFESETQWREYRLAARLEPPMSSSFCEDCLPEFKSAMSACSRCIHPEVWFDENNEGHREPKPAVNIRIEND